MRIISLQLINNKRIFNGMGIYDLSIDIPPSRIVRLVGPNGRGKSTVLNALSLLPIPNTDIIKGMDGLQAITVEDGDSTYVIAYRFTATKDSHQLKAYISKNGLELNPTGNVTSCKDIIYDVFGLDANFVSLTMMSGSGDGSLALKKPAERKKFISSILNTLEVYNGICKTLSKRSSIFKSVINNISNKMGNLGDPLQLKASIQMLESQITEMKSDRDTLVGYIAKSNGTDTLKEANDLRYKISSYDESRGAISMKLWECKEALCNANNGPIDENTLPLPEDIASLYSNAIDEYAKLDSNLSKLTNQHNNDIRERNNLKMDIDKLEAKVRAAEMIEFEYETTHRLLLDTEANMMALKLIPGIDKRWVTGIDIQRIKDIFLSVKGLPSRSISEYDFIRHDGTIDKSVLFELKHKLYHDILNGTFHESVYTLDTIDGVVIDVAKIVSVANLIESYNRDLVNCCRGIGASHIKSLFGMDLNVGDMILHPDFSSVIDRVTNLITDVTMLETCESDYKSIKDKFDILKMSHDNLDEIRSELNSSRDRYNKINGLLTETESAITSLNCMLSKVREKRDKYAKLNSLIPKHRMLTSELNHVTEKFNDAKARLANIDNFATNIQESTDRLSILDSTIKSSENTLFTYKHSLNLITEYMTELGMYQAKYNKVERLKYHSSPSTGIQLSFIELYMSNILKIANRLLSLLFNGQFVLQNFVINESEFRIPCQGNGLPIDDISSMSASQVCMINMIVSFALLAHSSTKFKIIRLDEADNALDVDNRLQFPNILTSVMDILDSEQCFIISQNAEFASGEVSEVLLG